MRIDMRENDFISAWGLSRRNHGNTLSIYAPGMFVYHGIRGKYHAISLTSKECLLNCEHCKGQLLRSMPESQTPEELLDYAIAADKRGDIGILLTGGCDNDGLLPWERFVSTISEIKSRTNLRISIHPGQLNYETAVLLKTAGVDQALVDVIGSDETAEDVYHLKEGVRTVIRTMDALSNAEIELVPHIIFGIHFGRILGEYQALEILQKYPINKYVVVVLNPIKKTPMEKVIPPDPMEVARFIIKARFEMPGILASLGCARPGGKYKEVVDSLAIKAGINSIAIASDKAVNLALSLGLDIQYKSSCCSVN
ncbi:MAG: radical SAM protein [Desulfomonilaceae bacterium]